ncbi:hypothetical protein AKJ16_DCAP24162, partial [Drosera capensis]
MKQLFHGSSMYKYRVHGAMARPSPLELRTTASAIAEMAAPAALGAPAAVTKRPHRTCCICNTRRKKANQYGMIIVEAQTTYGETFVMGAENDCRCKCGNGCSCS